MADSNEFSRESFFSMVEKAVNPQFFLLMTSFALFADWALAYFGGFGARDIASGASAFNVALAVKLTLAFLAFSGLTSLVLPQVMIPLLLLYIDVSSLVQRAIYHLTERWFGPDAPPPLKQRPLNYVTARELEIEAHETQSDFLIRLCERDSQREERKDAQARKTQAYAFAALVFLLLNYWSTGTEACHTATCWSADHFGSSVPVWLAFCLFVWIVLARLHREWEPRWIFHPPLYRKLEKKEEEQRRQERQWEEENARHIAEMRQRKQQNKNRPEAFD